MDLSVRAVVFGTSQFVALTIGRCSGSSATDRVTIEFTAVENNDYRLRIADVTGRTLMMENGTAATGLNTKVLPLNGITAGVYMISIENEQ
ncbi:MAG: T9SS type A sorting domain-containing protein [Bacteroidetes bacterium]|nr:T9SS type A sorting domain-containing protein [Bacteroidota bacterium]